MPRQNVESREYKVMLRNDRFKGRAETVLRRANDLLQELSDVVAPLTLTTVGEFEDEGKRRRITFCDTADQHLNEAGYVCRLRENLASGNLEATLKFRHPDRHVAQDRDMGAARGNRAKTKFEEDVKTPFVSLYSYSTTVPVGEKRPFRRLGDVAALFPGIDAVSSRGDRAKKVAVVNDFVAHERVLEGAKIKLARTPRVHADCALVIWSRGERETPNPVAVEFSFRYGDKNEEYGGELAASAFFLFASIQQDLDRWLSKSALTKTALVYGKGEGI